MGGEGADDRNRFCYISNTLKLEEGDLPGIPHPHHYSHQPSKRHVTPSQSLSYRHLHPIPVYHSSRDHRSSRYHRYYIDRYLQNRKSSLG
jgi:hypothetical protein